MFLLCEQFPDRKLVVVESRQVDQGSAVRVYLLTEIAEVFQGGIQYLHLIGSDGLHD